MEQREIDRSRFVQEIQIKAIRLPASRTQSLVKSLAQYLFNRKGFPKIAHVDEDSAQRLLLLRQDLQEIPEEITSLNLPVIDYTVRVTYEQLSYGNVHVRRSNEAAVASGCRRSKRIRNSWPLSSLQSFRCSVALQAFNRASGNRRTI
jgi:hypothetical protein